MNDSKDFMEKVKTMHEDVSIDAEEVVLPNAALAHKMAIQSISKNIKVDIAEKIRVAIMSSLFETTIRFSNDEWKTYGRAILNWLDSYGYKTDTFVSQLASNGTIDDTDVRLNIKW